MRINLSKALKFKNRIAGDLKKLQTVLMRDNSYKVGGEYKQDSERDARVLTTFNKIGVLQANLANMKALISIANKGISDKLASLEENKARIQFFNNLRSYIREGPEDAFSDKPAVMWHSYYNNAQIDTFIDLIQGRINTLQDEIDEFNASTFIEVVDDILG